ncbi:uncharacterized protein LOC131010933 [Salvia miltiorrhiza]|uniref:uncharacterized protein LOC131010933 n=1 Tax=Salvia miltiorrhiza TaxID=226208 RepID=UPI0025AC0723|nr:uncharacterized protein LOC131010933 [Salvia miltiorrhiza]
MKRDSSLWSRRWGRGWGELVTMLQGKNGPLCLEGLNTGVIVGEMVVGEGWWLEVDGGGRGGWRRLRWLLAAVAGCGGVDRGWLVAVVERGGGCGGGGCWSCGGGERWWLRWWRWLELGGGGWSGGGGRMVRG